ncbi:MAG: 3-hydroxyacyl-ACP dehydratase FabZ [Candidatus Viridilinea halotolerans]|uniref:3-hydroxyacyl-[acyl-carrier-protein] dehydratase FabZ n=1 Tax=Candidatus Viridilinea halotolerans TaxID=2491704 RepID=A0A426TVW5_9CHLR|nr:MAG: 3-hydroxyacyl-ACP dehydratase FabZ [Candidatus Viridilinea halotolerans]
MLTTQEIMAIIPHRYPFLLIDRVVELEPGVRVVAEKLVTANEPQFQGHFPGNPVMPGVLIVEAMAQAGAVAALSLPEHTGKLVLFAGIDDCRFKRVVRPGDTLRIEVQIERMRRSIGRGRGRATVGDELACEAGLLFALTHAEEERTSEQMNK